MIKTDEDALICDLAETYNIYDYHRLPLQTVATFSLGLKNDSRIRLKMAGLKLPLDSMLMAMQVDLLSLLVWSKTKDAEKNRNRPQSIYELLVSEPKENEIVGFESGKDFEAIRNEILERIGGED